MVSILKYTAIRIILIAGFAGVFYLLGMRSYLLAFAAIICGAMAVFIFFPRQGQEAAGSVESLVSKREHEPANKPASGPSDEDIEDEIIDETTGRESRSAEAVNSEPTGTAEAGTQMSEGDAATETQERPEQR